MSDAETNITEPTRVQNFARFFKNYMSIWSIVVAALPIPITSFELLPVFSFQKNIFSTYTTLFCFLLLGFIFYSRHSIAKYFFPYYYIEKQGPKLKLISTFETLFRKKDGENTDETTEYKPNFLERENEIILRKSILFNSLPLILILLSVANAFCYNFLIESQMATANRTSRVDLLKASFLPPDQSTLLMASYLGIFLCAEAAFILMAVKEYMQDLLKIGDDELMLRIFKQTIVKEETTA